MVKVHEVATHCKIIGEIKGMASSSNVPLNGCVHCSIVSRVPKVSDTTDVLQVEGDVVISIEVVPNPITGSS